jgi:ABC-2 type transport system permease protein
MREALLVAKREYLERIRSKAFLFMTIAFPLLMSLSFGGSLLASKLGSGHKHIVVASNDAALAQAVVAELNSKKDSQQTTDLLAPATEDDRAALTKRVDAKDIDGYLWLQTHAELGHA